MPLHTVNINELNQFQHHGSIFNSNKVEVNPVRARKG